MGSARRSRRRKDSNVGLLVALLVGLLVVVGGAAFLLLDAQDGPAESPVAMTTPEPAAEPAPVAPAPVRDRAPERLQGAVERTQPAQNLAEIEPGTPVSAIAGRVETPEGQPLPQARLSVYRGNPMLTASFPGSREGLDVSAVSGPDGSFRLEQVPVGKNYVLVAEHPEYAVTELRNHTLRPERELTGVVVRMERGAAICGRVLDLGEGPIAQARVEFYDSIASAQQEPQDRRPWKVVLTDPGGKFCFEHVSAQAYRLRVTAPGFETQSRSFSSAFEGKPSDQDVTFHLDAGRDLPGRVVDDAGNPLGQVFLEAVAMTKDYQAQVLATSAADGSFLLEGLGESPYTLRATADGYSRYSRSNISADEGELLVEMQRQIGVEGWVRNAAGEPVRNFQVALMRAHPGRDPMLMPDLRRFSDPEGHFVFDKLDPGNYALQVRARDYAVGQSDSFTVHREQTTPSVEVVLTRGGTLRGRVLDPDGEPVRGAKVSLHENNYVDLYINAIFGEAMGSVEFKVETRTDAEGRYVLEHLTPGTYQVRASHMESAPAVLNDVVVLDDDRGTNLPLDLHLPRGASLAGRALTQDGRPLPFTTVSVNRGGEFNEMVSTDKDGLFRLENLLEGTYEVRLQPDKDEAGKPLNPLISMVYASKSKQEIFVREGQQLTGVTLVAPRMTQP